MFKKQTFIYYIFFVLLFTSCTNSSEATNQGNESFFDLKNFFTKEIEKLEKEKAQLKKTVQFGEASETKKIEEPNWKKEFKVFNESDINKVAWLDKYRIDSSQTQLRYTALEEDLKTQEVEILFDRNKDLTSIKIKNQTQNVLYGSTEELIYLPFEKKIEIQRQQKVVSGKDESLRIIGEILY